MSGSEESGHSHFEIRSWRNEVMTTFNTLLFSQVIKLFEKDRMHFLSHLNSQLLTALLQCSAVLLTRPWKFDN